MRRTVSKGRLSAKSFGERLVQALALAGLTQDVLAERLEVRQATVSAWATGQGLPKGEQLVRLPMILGVDGHWLLTGDGAARRPASGVMEKGYGLISGIVHAIEDDPETVERMWRAWELKQAFLDGESRGGEGP